MHSGGPYRAVSDSDPYPDLTLPLLSPKMTLWYAVVPLSPFLSLSLLTNRGRFGCAGFALSSVDTLRARARLRKTYKNDCFPRSSLFRNCSH